MNNTKPSAFERALFLFSPTRGEKAYGERMRREQMERAQERTAPKRMASTGYGNHGASKTLTSMIGWQVGGGAAEDDIDLHGSELRKRARDLYAGGGLARSGPATLTTNVVGWGIQPKPKIDGKLLGLSDEAATEWEENALREFQLWAKSKTCDAERTKNFYALQELAFRSMLMSGDVFALFEMKENKRTPYQLAIRLIEADRICNPDSSGDSDSSESGSGGRIVDGVEITQDGEVVRYYIANRHPLMENASGSATWTSIDAYGADTGEANILHIMTHERPEQRRGIPFVSAEIERLKQLDRYINSSLAGKLVSSMLTAFVVTDADDGKPGMEDAVNADEKVSEDEYHLELAPGAIYDLPPGKKIQHIDPQRNDSGFESFVSALEMLIGSGFEIPKEVLIKKYESNYTAARSALLDFWKTVRVYRNRFCEEFNAPIYEAWLSEAVATGRIEAPGFFEDPAIRAAWCGCMWIGSSMGHVDPMKEVSAAEKRIMLNISTQEQEASEYNGGNWAEIVRQRKKEIAEMPTVITSDGGQDPKETDGEGNENAEE